MKKILLVTTGLGAGGAERLVVNLADFYSNQGHEVTLAYLTDKDTIFFQPKNKGIKMVGLNMTKSPIGIMAGLKRLITLIKSFEPDVVHSHMYHANILARVARIFTPVNKLISSVHNTNEGGVFRMMVYRITDFIPDISTNVSNEALNAFIDKKATRVGRMVAVVNGIDTDYFAYSDNGRKAIRKELSVREDDYLIVSVGRLVEAKNFDSLLLAFKKVVRQFNNAKLAITGIGPLEGSLKDLSKKLGLEEKVVFLGSRRDIPALMSASDVFVLSSLWEGFGLVVAEAMACERVVVATDCGGVKEVLGDSGFLIPKGDVNQLANHIEKALLLTEYESVILGKRARKRVIENFSLEKNAAEYFELY